MRNRYRHNRKVENVSKTVVRRGTLANLEGWAFEVYYRDREYPNFISALYSTKRKAEEALQKYLDTGEMEFYGDVERDKEYNSETHKYNRRYRHNPSDYPVEFKETLENFEVSQRFNHSDGFDYYLVLAITDVEEASGESEMLANGKWLVALDLVPTFASFDREHQKSILSSSGITRKEVSSEDIQMYGCSLTINWKQGDDLDLILEELKKEAQIVPTMVGFYLDKRVNRIGETGWDWLEKWGVISDR